MIQLLAIIMTGLSMGMGHSAWNIPSSTQNTAVQVMPTEGRFTSDFGFRKHPIRGGHCMHAGVDIANEKGTDIEASGAGTVVSVERERGYGLMVVIDHGHGWTTRYAHLSEALVKEGDKVAAGTLIAKMGSTGSSTGSHLHFEVRHYTFAVNPMPYLTMARAAYAVNQ